MECQDATTHIANYLAGSLPVEDVEALFTHAAACTACRDKLTAAADPLGMRRRVDAVLAGDQDGVSGRSRRSRRLSRCATCHFPGQSCSWICRMRWL